MAEHACPYCNSDFDDKEDLSRHIDRIHGDSGLLEGGLRQQQVAGSGRIGYRHVGGRHSTS